MKNKLVFALSLVFVVIFVSVGVGLFIFRKDDSSPESLYIREGNYIYFGEYPQTVKADNVTIGETTDAQGYYLGSDSERYCEKNGQYFKVEKLKWRILEESKGKALIICDNVIDASVFQDNIWLDDYIGSSRYYYGNRENGVFLANEYAPSLLRNFMHTSIFLKAFDTEEQSIVGETYLEDVDSWVRVFAPSRYELTGGNDSLSEDLYKSLIFYPTDYAVSAGATVYSEGAFGSGVSEEIRDLSVGSSSFFTRTPVFFGRFFYGYYVLLSTGGSTEVDFLMGVCPALYLVL